MSEADRVRGTRQAKEKKRKKERQTLEVFVGSGKAESMCIYVLKVYSTVECVFGLLFGTALQSGRICFPLLYFSVLSNKNGERGKCS